MINAGYSGILAGVFLAAVASVPAEAGPPCRHYRASPGYMVSSYYGEGTHVATGARFDRMGMTAAHLTLRFGTMLHVCRGRQCVSVQVNDRGPAAWTGCALDLSLGAALKVGLAPVHGVAKLKVHVPMPKPRPEIIADPILVPLVYRDMSGEIFFHDLSQ